ncbi:MAG: polysaccharide deacetylase family protein [Candidatus Omnitrophica bacterium]|nr:polysaccharide deacetylase family protein [Candidatus Omnitrophota bacterium]
MKFKKTFLVLIIIFSIAGVYFHLQSRYVVPILMYHHIDGDGEDSSLSVSPENFRRQMQFLAAHKYNTISLAEFVQSKVKGEKLPHNSVVITFDDGYADNYGYAYPVLKEYQIPATIFVIVDAIGEEEFVNLEQMKEMCASGVITIGSHSLSHVYLPDRDKTTLEREIAGSKTKLEARLREKIDFFCYPIGHFNEKIQQIVKAAGYQAACTTNRGRVETNLNQDLFALKRIKITDSWPNLFIFWVKLSGYYNLFRTARSPY